MSERICTIEGCGKPHIARGWCDGHYRCWQRNGAPEYQYKPTVEERFWSYVEKSLGDACWLWTGRLSPKGYGAFSVDHTRPVGAHRVAYELSVGPVPDGLQLDHLCHSNDLACLGGTDCPHRRCVRPDHLEPVTYLENLHRGQSFTGINFRKTHCPQNHPYDEANTLVIVAVGSRQCRTCNRERARRYRAARRLVT